MKMYNLLKLAVQGVPSRAYTGWGQDYKALYKHFNKCKTSDFTGTERVVLYNLFRT